MHETFIACLNLMVSLLFMKKLKHLSTRLHCLLLASIWKHPTFFIFFTPQHDYSIIPNFLLGTRSQLAWWTFLWTCIIIRLVVYQHLVLHQGVLQSLLMVFSILIQWNNMVMNLSYFNVLETLKQLSPLILFIAFNIATHSLVSGVLIFIISLLVL